MDTFSPDAMKFTKESIIEYINGKCNDIDSDHAWRYLRKPDLRKLTDARMQAHVNDYFNNMNNVAARDAADLRLAFDIQEDCNNPELLKQAENMCYSACLMSDEAERVEKEYQILSTKSHNAWIKFHDIIKVNGLEDQYDEIVKHARAKIDEGVRGLTKNRA